MNTEYQHVAQQHGSQQTDNFSFQGNGPDSIIDEIVITLYPPVIQERCELVPMNQGIVHLAIPCTGCHRGMGYKKGLDLLIDRRRFLLTDPSAFYK